MVQKLRLLEEQNFTIYAEDWDTDLMNNKLIEIQDKSELIKQKAGVK